VDPKKKMSLCEIATRIGEHLCRFERDPKINRRDPEYHTSRFYMAGAGRAGRYVSVTYIGYQGSLSLSRDQAAAYLAWLDAGHVGTHFEWRDEVET
jgi:hypothetical protein